MGGVVGEPMSLGFRVWGLGLIVRGFCKSQPRYESYDSDRVPIVGLGLPKSF